MLVSVLELSAVCGWRRCSFGLLVWVKRWVELSAWLLVEYVCCRLLSDAFSFVASLCVLLARLALVSLALARVWPTCVCCWLVCGLTVCAAGYCVLPPRLWSVFESLGHGVSAN